MPSGPEVRNAFKKFTQDGTISEGELLSILTKPSGGNPLTEAEARVLVSKITGRQTVGGDAKTSVSDFISVCVYRVPAKPSVPSGPVCYLTSTGFVTESQWARFIKVLLKRKGVLDAADVDSEDRAALVAKYGDTLKALKVTYINDASYHRPPENMAAGRAGDGKVGENGHLGRGPGTWFWWDQGLEDKMGIPQANIKMIQLLEKPWLFNRPGRLANCEAASPNVAALDAADEEAYFKALQLTQDAYDALKEKEPKVGAGQAGGSLPGCPASGVNCADELAEVSARLNTKYAVPRHVQLCSMRSGSMGSDAHRRCYAGLS